MIKENGLPAPGYCQQKIQEVFMIHPIMLPTIQFENLFQNVVYNTICNAESTDRS
jgi:hypothetical protein